MTYNTIAAEQGQRQESEAETGQQPSRSYESDAEELGHTYAKQIADFVDAHEGHFGAELREDPPKKVDQWHSYIRFPSDELNELFEYSFTVPLNFEADNPELAEVFLRACGTTHLSEAARCAIARLQAHALMVERDRKAARRERIRAESLREETQ